jgi:hypothetical protein
MSAHDGRVKHELLHVAVRRKMLEQLFKDLEFTPSGEAFINRVPVTVLAGQESPLRAGASDPQDGLEKTATIASGSEPGTLSRPLYGPQTNRAPASSLPNLEKRVDSDNTI